MEGTSSTVEAVCTPRPGDGSLFPPILPSLSGLWFWDGLSQKMQETESPKPLPRGAQDPWQALSRSTSGLLDPAPLREELGAQSLSNAPPCLLASVFLFHKWAGASSTRSAGGPSCLGWAGGLRTSRSSCPEVGGPACLVVGLSGLCLASWTTSGEEGGTLTSHPCSLAPLFGARVTLCLLEGPGQKACERGSAGVGRVF